MKTTPQLIEASSRAIVKDTQKDDEAFQEKDTQTMTMSSYVMTEKQFRLIPTFFNNACREMKKNVLMQLDAIGSEVQEAYRGAMISSGIFFLSDFSHWTKGLS